MRNPSFFDEMYVEESSMTSLLQMRNGMVQKEDNAKGENVTTAPRLNVPIFLHVVAREHVVGKTHGNCSQKERRRKRTRTSRL
jgi:hypothetical protein